MLGRWFALVLRGALGVGVPAGRFVLLAERPASQVGLVYRIETGVNLVVEVVAGGALIGALDQVRVLSTG